MNDFYRRYCESMQSCLDHVEITDQAGSILATEDGFELACALSQRVKERKGTQFLVGNGASAAFASHMALDWSKNGHVSTLSFGDLSVLSAVGNDCGFDEAFSTPLTWHAKSGDLLITISSSGNSPNITSAIERARRLGMAVVTLSGLKPDNRSRQLGDLNLFAPARTYGIVECAHQILLHAWLDRYMGIEEWGRDTFQNMRKDEFQL